ncbi:K+-sensing histidine kinase KdpD [Bradyrhizobium barranii subsp. barranii]|uniref:sensor histidine kinase n=1 Tax=Bradyrhizobium liaoningense TaxID=43992 RepID=UPI001BAB272F|nr:sensor histidine kinase [Bradyrhizobium liaoningense]MBR0884031.1 sensor histidine kinase [Bradyrhizobium liaoningense]
MTEQKAYQDEQVFSLTLMANFVHQVVNPLNAVCGTLDNIVQGDVPVGTVKQRINASRSQIEYCVELIRNLAFLAEYTRDPVIYRQRHAGKVTVIPQVLIQAALFFQETGRKKQMKIHMVDRETQYKVNADPDLLRQVFINLFDNGVKYAHRATDIIVRTHIQKRTNDLLIEVINQSDPIPRELWEKIFEVGFRGENAQRLIASGTGLGLYICRLILSVYNGSITYSGARSSESIFTIRLPGAWA